MALELHMALETALGVQIAVVGAGDRNLAAMAQMIVAQAIKGEIDASSDAIEGLSTPAVSLVGIHSASDLSPEEASRLEHAVRVYDRGDA